MIGIIVAVIVGNILTGILVFCGLVIDYRIRLWFRHRASAKARREMVAAGKWKPRPGDGARGVGGERSDG